MNKTCPKNNLLNTVCPKTREHLPPLANGIDGKIIEHNITLTKLILLTTTVSGYMASSSERQDLDLDPTAHIFNKLVKILNDVVLDLK